VLSCQAAVNACCDDATCSTGLSYLDGCASGDSSSCVVLVEGGQYANSPPFAMMGACVGLHCSMCSLGTGIPIPGFDAGFDAGMDAGMDTAPPLQGPSCDMADGTCFCEIETSPTSSTACTPTMFDNGICCADANWPNAGTSCTCSPFSCNVYSTGCDCSAEYDPASSQPVSACGGMTCCVDNSNDGLCTCSTDGSCDGSDQSQVGECAPSNTGCGGSQVWVGSCSG
jgi:hypothetical protein